MGRILAVFTEVIKLQMMESRNRIRNSVRIITTFNNNHKGWRCAAGTTMWTNDAYGHSPAYAIRTIATL